MVGHQALTTQILCLLKALRTRVQCYEHPLHGSFRVPHLQTAIVPRFRIAERGSGIDPFQDILHLHHDHPAPKKIMGVLLFWSTPIIFFSICIFRKLRLSVPWPPFEMAFLSQPPKVFDMFSIK
jgi:hypothetical protein